MTVRYLTGEQLQVPPLRFNASSARAQHQDARQGLKRYGPYDAQRLAKDRVRCAIVYPAALSDLKGRVIYGLCNGNGVFGGFVNLFRISIEFV